MHKMDFTRIVAGARPAAVNHVLTGGVEMKLQQAVVLSRQPQPAVRAVHQGGLHGVAVVLNQYLRSAFAAEADAFVTARGEQIAGREFDGRLAV